MLYGYKAISSNKCLAMGEVYQNVCSLNPSICTQILDELRHMHPSARSNQIYIRLQTATEELSPRALMKHAQQRQSKNTKISKKRDT